ncbi:hypothetical protein [Streptomyces avermitilis]|nr:hypothetical protein [Streptomyces avermitilis]
MTHAQPPEPLPCHRLALTSARHRWWRPLTGTLLVTGGWIVAILVLATGGMLLVPGGDDAGLRWAGWDVFAPAMAMLVLVPLQSAAEEYVFRGWLMQAAGAFFRSPWFAIVPPS